MTKRHSSGPVASKKPDTHLLLSLQQQGKSESAIVAELRKQGIQCSKSTVHRRLRDLSLVTKCPTKSTKKCQAKLSARVKRWLVREIRVHRQVTTKQLHACAVQLGYTVCKRTVHRLLKTVPTLKLKRPKKVTHMLPRHKTDRLKWVKECLEKKIDWTKAWFADEKLWYIDGPTQRPEIWQDTRGPIAGIPTKGRRNTAVCVFGAVSLGGVSELIVLPSHFDWRVYCDAVKKALLTSGHNQNYTLYHDRNPPHTNKQTHAWMADNHLPVVLLPPKSADLNPIENLWALLSREVYGEMTTYNSTQALIAAIKAAWGRVQQNRPLRRNLVGSMPERLQAVLAAKGGQTKF